MGTHFVPAIVRVFGNCITAGTCRIVAIVILVGYSTCNGRTWRTYVILRSYHRHS